MDSLRISLIVIGVVILLALYLWSRAGQHRSKKSVLTREEPQFDAVQNSEKNDDWEVIPIKPKEPLKPKEPQIDNPDPIQNTGTVSAVKQQQAHVAEPQSKPSDEVPVALSTPQADSESSDQVDVPAVIALHIVANDGEFVGSDLVKAANLAGMRYGEMGIFHFQGVSKGDVTFSMANMLEPGTFDMENLDGFSSPGVLLFMESEFQKELEKSLDSMARVAQRICEVLNGQLCDERRRPFKVEQLDAWKEHLLGTQPQL